MIPGGVRGEDGDQGLGVGAVRMARRIENGARHRRAGQRGVRVSGGCVAGPADAGDQVGYGAFAGLGQLGELAERGALFRFLMATVLSRRCSCR